MHALSKTLRVELARLTYEKYTRAELLRALCWPDDPSYSDNDLMLHLHSRQLPARSRRYFPCLRIPLNPYRRH